MPSYQQNKIHIYKWCENNIERSRQIKRKWKQRNDAWKKIKIEFLSILLY